MQTMFKAVALKLAGMVMALGPLLGLVLSLLTRGWRRTLTVKRRPLPPDIVNDPKWGEHRYVRIPNLRVHYVEKGDHDKPLMVFLHGFPEFWFSWRNQLEYLSKDYWCVAPDGRGYGDTEKPTGIDEYTIDKLATDVKNLVNALGRKECVLVGHDWGGGVGYAVCARYPELVRCYIACNIAHPGAFLQSQRENWSQRFKSWYMIFFQCPVIPEFLLRLNDLEAFDSLHAEMKHPERATSEVVEAYKFAYKDKNAFYGPLNYYRAALQTESSLDPGKVKVPVLNLFGTGDRYIDTRTSQMSGDFVEDYTERLFEGISHWVTIDEPEAVNRAMEEYLKDRGI